MNTVGLIYHIASPVKTYIFKASIKENEENKGQ